MKNELNYIKGEMGNNEVICLYGEEITEIKNLIDTGLKILKKPYLRGDQCVYCFKDKGKIKVKIIDRSLEDFFEMCGGFTQVFGKALLEFKSLSDYFELDIERKNKIEIITDSGKSFVEIYRKNDEILSDMMAFAKLSKKQGIKKISINDVKGYKVGKYLVLNANDIKNSYQNFNPATLDNESKNILKELQEEWIKNFASNENYFYNFSLYDKFGEDNNLRGIFPHGISKNNHIEPSCGTGSIAIFLSLLNKGYLPGEEQLKIESGGDNTLGGPDITKINYKLIEGDLMDLKFSHSNVEILSKGKIFL